MIWTLSCGLKRHPKHVGTSCSFVWKVTTMGQYFIEWWRTSLCREGIRQEREWVENLFMENHLKYTIFFWKVSKHFSWFAYRFKPAWYNILCIWYSARLFCSSGWNSHPFTVCPKGFSSHGECWTTWQRQSVLHHYGPHPWTT